MQLRHLLLVVGVALLSSCGGKSTTSAGEPSPEDPTPNVSPAAANGPRATASASSPDAMPSEPEIHLARLTIPDTPENRAVLDAIEQYRQAMEVFDEEALVEMVHPDYSDSRGGSEIDHDEQVRVIHRLADRVRVSHLRIDIEKLAWPTPQQVEVDVEIDASYELGTVVRQQRDRVRLVLREHDGWWRFVSGM